MHDMISDAIGKPGSDVRRVFSEELADARIGIAPIDDEDDEIDDDLFGEVTQEAE